MALAGRYAEKTLLITLNRISSTKGAKGQIAFLPRSLPRLFRYTCGWYATSPQGSAHCSLTDASTAIFSSRNFFLESMDCDFCRKGFKCFLKKFIKGCCVNIIIKKQPRSINGLWFTLERVKKLVISYKKKLENDPTKIHQRVLWHYMVYKLT